jgi:hypothetical protein
VQGPDELAPRSDGKLGDVAHAVRRVGEPVGLRLLPLARRHQREVVDRPPGRARVREQRVALHRPLVARDEDVADVDGDVVSDPSALAIQRVEAGHRDIEDGTEAERERPLELVVARRLREPADEREQRLCVGDRRWSSRRARLVHATTVAPRG